MSFLIPMLPMLISGLMGGASKALSKDPKMEKLDTMNPQQQNFQKMILDMFSGQGGNMQGPLGELQKMMSGSPESTAAFEAPLQRQFQEQIVPGLAERFSGMGAGGQRSSAFQQALGGAGADLTEKLGALRGGMKMQGIQQLMSLLAPAMQSSFDYVKKDQKNPWSDFLGGFGGGMSPGAGKLTVPLAQKYWGLGS